MSNSSFKTCDAGHFYPASSEKCPYCKNQGNKNAEDVTVNINSPFLDNDKTKVVNDNLSNNSGNDDGKTVIFSNNSDKESPKVSVRKLVGWLVTYTLNENGIDFRLYEGKNTIGRAIESNIRISEDKLLSSNHATILYRGDSLYFKDEMSSNPSYVNEEEVMPGNTVKLKDGDILKIGENIFLLRLSNI